MLNCGFEDMQIALAYNSDHALKAGEPDDNIGVEGVIEQVEAVEQACLELGWEPRRVAVDGRLGAAVEILEAHRPDVVFSMVESIDGESRLEPAMAYVLEWLGIPYTGSPPVALALALDKPLARAVLASAGVRVPRGVLRERDDERLDGLRYPLIVKPSREDGSHGIRSESLVGDDAAARARVRYVIERYAQPALVEEFVDGREFSVSLTGPSEAPVVLPLREIVYTLPPHLPRLLGYEAKWMPETVEYQETMPASPSDLAPELAESIAAAAQAAYSAIGVRDYGRVDVRVHPSAGPLVLDVNPNPPLVPGGTFGLAAAALDAGLSFLDLVGFIVDQALARAQRGSNQTGLWSSGSRL